MTLGFGADFHAGLKGEQYQARTGQSLLVTAGFAVVLYIIFTLLQNVVGLLLLAVPAIRGDNFSLSNPVVLQVALARGMIVGIMFAALIASFICWKFASFKNDSGAKGIPLHIPDLGVAGWLTIVVGLLFLLWAVFNLTFVVLGIDPATYMPSKDGLNDAKSSAGLVEKTLADLSDESLLFALALPGVTIAVPIFEELVFRGSLFSAIRHSWFGRIGAVVITAAVWAVIHALAAPWLFVFVIFIMGLALGWLLLRFGSVVVPIVCHACWNTFSSLAIFSGQ